MELNKIYNRDNYELLVEMPSNSIDSIVTDPPYGLTKPYNPQEVLTAWMKDGYFHPTNRGFQGEKWDAFVPQPIFLKECLRVLKPGGFLLLFSASRMNDYAMMSLRLAGFEIRDQVGWLYSTGFPKSHKIDKKTSNPKWEGWGENLKPALDLIVVARKPLEGTLVQNINKWGVGAINVDACRIDDNGELKPQKNGSTSSAFQSKKHTTADDYVIPNEKGRFPTNVIRDDSDQVKEVFKGRERFFYVPKPSTTEKNMYLEGKKNPHNTVKPIDLMRYLVKMVTPPNGICLDPYVGSGTTALACMMEEFNFIGIELDSEFAQAAEERIKNFNKKVYF